ncbi:MAG TPA: PAS domain-containing protein [Baekduia sp.]
MLRLVPDPVKPTPLVSFCGHCGQAPPTEMAARSRVCSLCGLGVVITAAADLAPRERESFVIVDRQLKLCALSRGAERLLGVDEPEAVHRLVSDFLEPADAEAGDGDELLKGIVASAAMGFAPATSIVVRPAGEYGVRYAARVGSCGPPEGALIVLGTV